MTLNVLRDDSERGEKEMMKLIRYGGAASDEGTVGDDNGSLEEIQNTSDWVYPDEPSEPINP